MPLIPHVLHPALREWVRSCVGYDYRTAPDAVHRGLPSTGLTVILAFDEPLDCGWSDGGRYRFWTLLGGLHVRPAIIYTHGLQRGIQLSLSPLGARRLLGLPAAAMAGSLATAEEVGGTFAGLHERLHEADWPTRFHLVERHLLTHLDRTGGQETRLSPVEHAWQRITTTHGSVRIDDLAHDLGWSRRHLAARFGAEFGVGPKLAARLARFERATALARTKASLAAVAASCGYADQAHLNRDWLEFAGVPPRATLQESLGEFPNVQDR